MKRIISSRLLAALFQAIVMALAAALIAAGILNGGLADVLAKGAAICMEGVGLG